MFELVHHISSRPKPLPETKDLEFGKHFSDHWFYSRYTEKSGWGRAHIEPYGAIKLDPAASVLHYGQALFEGMKAFRQDDGSVSLFRPEFNWLRMCSGADRLCLAAPPRDLFMGGLQDLITQESRWVPQDEVGALYIRPTLIGTEAFLGVRPSREVLFYILLSPVASYYGRGGAPLRIWVEDKSIRAAPGGLGAVKAGANYAASLKTAQTAKRLGFDQVLWLDSEHQGIEEVGTMNVFWVLGDEIITPALNGSILPGCTRDSVLAILRHEGRRVSERRITMTEIARAHAQGELIEAFGTGTAAVISPIGELCFKGETLPIKPNHRQVAPHLLEMLKGIQRGRRPDPFGWMTPVAQLRSL